MDKIFNSLSLFFKLFKGKINSVFLEEKYMHMLLTAISWDIFVATSNTDIDLINNKIKGYIYLYPWE